MEIISAHLITDENRELPSLVGPIDLAAPCENCGDPVDLVKAVPRSRFVSSTWIPKETSRGQNGPRGISIVQRSRAKPAHHPLRLRKNGGTAEMVCDLKHTKPNIDGADWKCPKCGSKDWFIDDAVEGSEDCDLVHPDDGLRCSDCGHETSGRAFTAAFVRKQNLVPCAACHGKGYVNGKARQAKPRPQTRTSSPSISKAKDPSP